MISAFHEIYKKGNRESLSLPWVKTKTNGLYPDAIR